MVSSRAWFVLAVFGVLGLFYVGGGLRSDFNAEFPVASVAYGQEGNKHALVWTELPSIGIVPGSAIHRTRISGGWLVFGTIPSIRNSEPIASGLTFVPDPEHKWDGTSLK
jgi:hypothetical protein